MLVDENISLESSPNEAQEVAPGTETQQPQVTESEEFSDKEVREYLKSGKLPKEPADEKKPEETESAPSREPQPESAESAPASNSKGKGAEKRIAQLSSKIQEQLATTAQLRAEEARLRQNLDALRRGEIPNAEQPKTQAEPLKRPKLEDFSLHSEYEEALDAYIAEKAAKTAEEKIAAALEKEKQAYTEAEKAKAEQQRWSKFHDGVAQLGVEPSEFWEAATNPALPITEAAMKAMLAIGEGPKVLYHLTQNPDEAHRLAAISDPAELGAEIGQLAARIGNTTTATVNTTATVAKPTPRLSKAAPPPRELSTSNTAPADEVEALIKRAEAGDAAAVSAYMRLMNQRERSR